MIPHVFTRFGAQMRESGIVRGSFAFATAGDVWSAVAANGHTYNGMSVLHAGTGLVTVRFPACRDIEVISASLRSATPGTFGSIRSVELPPMTQAIAKAGTFALALYGAAALGAPADGSVLSLVLWLAR